MHWLKHKYTVIIVPYTTSVSVTVNCFLRTLVIFFPIFLLQNKSLHLLLSLLTQVSLFSLKSILSLLSLVLYLVLKLARSNQTIKKQKNYFTIFHFALPSPIQLSFEMVHSLLSFDMSVFWLIFPISVAAGGTKCLCLSTAK